MKNQKYQEYHINNIHYSIFSAFLLRTCVMIFSENDKSVKNIRAMTMYRGAYIKNKETVMY